MEAIINQPTVLNGNNGTNALIFGKDLSGQTLSGTYTLIACVGSVTVTSGKFYLYNCSGLVVTNQNNAATVIRDGFAIGDYYFSANENPASKFGGYWEEVPNGTFLMAAGAGGAVDQTGGSADAVAVRHGGHIRPANVGTETIPAADYEVPPSDSNSYFINTDNLTSLVSNSDSRTFMKEYGNELGFRTIYKGEDGTGKNLPPYRTAHIYKRIANPGNSNMQ